MRLLIPWLSGAAPIARRAFTICRSNGYQPATARVNRSSRELTNQASIVSDAGRAATSGGVSRRYHSASSAALQPEPAAVIAWR